EAKPFCGRFRADLKAHSGPMGQKAARNMPETAKPQPLALLPPGFLCVQSGLGVAAADLPLLLALLFGVQGIEIDRLQQQWREATVQDQLGNDLPREREQHV